MNLCFYTDNDHLLIKNPYFLADIGKKSYLCSRIYCKLSNN